MSALCWLFLKRLFKRFFFVCFFLHKPVAAIDDLGEEKGKCSLSLLPITGGSAQICQDSEEKKKKPYLTFYFEIIFKAVHSFVKFLSFHPDVCCGSAFTLNVTGR